MKKILSTLLILSCFIFVGCKSTPLDYSADYDTKEVTQDNFKCDIPSSWEIISNNAEDKATFTQLIFAPKGTDAKKLASNVNIVVTKTDKEATSMSDFKKDLEGDKTQSIKSFFTEATDFSYDYFSVPSGEVASMKYTIDAGDNDETKMTQNLCYILIDNYTITVTSASIDDNTSPDPEDVLKCVLSSFSID